MSSAAPEKLATPAEQAVVEPATPSSAPSDAPRAPVPLPVVGREPAAAKGPSLPEGAPPLLSEQQAQVHPKTMDDLLALNDWNIRFLCAGTAPHGMLMDVLKTAFEADWFRAKACLVFDKWPEGRTRTNFTHESALQLMTALTVLRGNVHNAVKPLAQERVKTSIAERAAKLKGNASLAGGLTAQAGVEGAKQVEFKGSVGADTVTSDVDVSTGGINSELAVRAYNEEFRRFVKVPLDPGTVFDLNVYAKDFIFGFNDNADKTVIDPKTENAEKPSAPKAADRDREQDIWALVHVSRYLPDDADWDRYVADSLAGLDELKRPEQEERLSTARRRSKGFEFRLLAMMEHLTKSLDLGLGKSAATWGAEESAHYEEGAVRMRAANKLYEDKLLQVKELRLQIETVRAKVKESALPADAAQLDALITKLDGELSMAQLYANEVYGSGGGTVHAVIGMQLPKKLTTERGKKVTADLPKQQWYQSFTDNLGDVLKDFEHYGKAGAHGDPDYWYAAFKMGKYANRMIDCLDHLADGKDDDIISTEDAGTFAANPQVALLKELSEHHLVEKDGDGGRDPMTLRTHPYFRTMDQAKVAGLRTAALTLGSTVRGMAARKGPLVGAPVRPKRGADITTEQVKQMSLAVKHAMEEARKVKVEAAGPS
ncbi:hypothetical protein [Nocardioides conyzicola]|uniref:Uncharacterized protein n=1 Tax=Nocardioides conyzicola TaxID=1651781 RepID=A0ABP8WHN0_9ACTN